MPSYVKRILSFFENTKIGYYFKIDKKIVLHRQDLALILGVSAQSIKNYEAKGLKSLNSSPNRTPLYELHYALDWHRGNVATKFRPNRQKQDQPQAPSEESNDLIDFLEQLPAYKKDVFNSSELDIMDKLAKLKDIEKKEIDNKIKLGELIDANDVDKNNTALAAMFLGSLINFEKVSGSVLGKKEEHEIPKLIRAAHDNVFEELNSLVSKEFKCDETLYEVIGAVLVHLNQGVGPKEIIEKLGS